MKWKEKIEKNRKNINWNTAISLSLFILMVFLLISTFADLRKDFNIINQNQLILNEKFSVLEILNKVDNKEHLDLLSCKKGCELAGNKFLFENAFASRNFNIYKCFEYCFEELRINE